MEKRRSRRLNLKVAILLPIIVAVLAGGVYGLHAFQVNRLGRKMLGRAKEAQEAGKLDDAIRNYQYFLQYEPKRDDVFSTLALLMAEQSRKSGNLRSQISAYQALEKAAIRDPDNIEIVRQLADLSMQTNQFRAAIEHLKRLSKLFPKESDLVVKLGHCQVATEHYREAETTFRDVIGLDPHAIAAYVGLATLLRDKSDDRDGADAVMNRLVAANPDSAQAYIERARYWQIAEIPDAAKADLDTALERWPNDCEVLLAATEFALEDKDVKEAQEHIEHAKQLFPNDTRVLQLTADVLRAQNNLGAYQKAQEEVLEKGDKKPEALFRVIEAQLATKDSAAVWKTLAQMKKAGYRPELLEFFEIRLLLTEDKVQEAVGRLERLRRRVTNWGQLVVQIDMTLGACYEQMRQPERQLEAFRRVLTVQPSLLGARIGYAAALFRLGKNEQALTEYRKLKETMGTDQFIKVAGLRNTLFQLSVLHNAALPEKQRNWKEAENLLIQAGQAGYLDELEKPLMQAELFLRKGDARQARTLLEELQEKHPKEPGVWRALATAVAAEKDAKAALAVLDAAGKELDNNLTLELSRVGLATRLDSAAGKEVLDAVAARASNLPAAEQPAIWQALGGAYYRLADRPKAKEMWTRLATALPNDPRIRLTLFELARESNDAEGMLEAVEAVKKAQGAQSAEWCYCEASRLVWQVQHKKAEPAVLEEVHKLLRTAAQQRPAWQDVARLEAETALLEDRIDDAIKFFQRANDLGGLPPIYQGQLARLLFARGRYDEAKMVLDQIGPDRSSPLLEKMEAEVAHRLGRPEEALKRAAESVAESKKAIDHLWYGQMLLRANKVDEAEKAFRRGIELEPNVPDSYLALASLLVQTKRTPEAEKVVQQAEAQEFPEDRRPLVLGECYLMLGKSDRTEQYYQDALAKKPEDLFLLRRTTELYLRLGRADQARKYVEQILSLGQRDPEASRDSLIWARRVLAQLMAETGEYPQLQKALTLLEENATDGKLAPQDLRIRALLLARTGERKAKQEAVSLLESLQSHDTPLDPADQFVLAQLYDRTDRWNQGRELMMELVTRYPKEIRFLVQFIQMLMSHDASGDELAPWIDRLEQEQPDLPLTKIVKARVLAKTGKTGDAVKLLESLIPRPLPPEKAAYLRDVAGLLEGLEQYESAKRLLTEFAEKTPGGSLNLAAFLGRHGTSGEALDQCEAAAKTVPMPVVLPVAIGILHSQGEKAKPADFDRVDGWFQKAMENKDDAKALQLQLAALRELQERYDDLIKIYRDYLAREDLVDRERAVVWNNLAYSLIVSGGDAQEAKKMVDQAITIIGPNPEMLDTRGFVALALDKPSEAVADFRQAIEGNPSGMKHYHLALALFAAGDRKGARAALQTAQDTYHMSAAEVPKLERARYQKLVDDLKDR